MKRNTLAHLGSIVVIGFLSNLIWEKLHISLYKDYEVFVSQLYLPVSVYTALVDVGIVFLIYGIVACVFRKIYWIMNPQWKHYVLTAVLGAGLSILIEWNALARSQWAYAPSMPVIPVINTGLSPILQMTILPVITFTLVSLIVKHNKKLYG